MTHDTWVTFKTLVAKEFLLIRRNKWLTAGAWVSALLAAAVVFGTAAVGGTLVYRDFATVKAALAALLMYVMPLLAVLAVSDAFAAEREQGTLLLMLTYPVGRETWGLAKLTAYAAGLAAALLPALVMMVGLKIMMPLPWTWGETLSGLLELGFGAWLYAAGFAALGCAVSLGTTKARALAYLLILWFAAVFLWDLILLTMAVMLAGDVPSSLFTVLMTLNSADAFRMLMTPAAVSGFSAPAAVSWGVLFIWWVAGTGLTLTGLRRLSV